MVHGVAEILHRPHEPENLLPSADSVFIKFGFSFKETPKIFRFVAFGIYYLVFLELVNNDTVGNIALLFLSKNRPYFRHILANHLLKRCAYHIYP